MITVDIDITKSDGSSDVRSVFFPDSIDEILLRDWDQFHQKLADAPEWFIELNSMDKESANDTVGEWSPMMWAMYYHQIADLASCFSNADLNEILHLPTAGKPMKPDAEKGMHDAGSGLLAIYHKIIEMLATYEPDIQDTFEHKGRTYKVFPIADSLFGPETPAPNINVISAIQALQSEHVLTAVDEETGERILKDFKFQSDTAILAALSRRVLKNNELEQMPLDLELSEMWLQKRMKEFETIPMNIAENVSFFLLDSKRRSLNIRSFNMLSAVMLTTYIRHQ